MSALHAYASRLWPFSGRDTESLGWPPPEDSIAISDAEYVVFDTELTGLDRKRDSIVSIGAVRMKGGRLIIGDNFYRVTAPRTELDRRSVVIHGITPSAAAQCPPMEKILPEFLDFCRGAVLVGHFVSIDLHFLSAESQKLTGRRLDLPTVDTLSLYRWRRSRTENGCAYYEGGCEGGLDLASVARAFKIDPPGSHHALADAFVTAQVFQRFLSVLPEMGITTIGQLLKIGKG